MDRVVERLERAYREFMPALRLVKRYAKTRLYDTVAASYVTLADLRAWKITGRPFVVIDVETGEDITHILLA